eukprot:TRINITY_DN1662_c0_g1_i1.p1 TRINITY_DN1662_c0_g1~~TRINITY_DN1662_c0_g1_i1.p1  ORF type:complete len:215 (-),score=36.79 TRINITY_DN1662_c0_g1_i1:51-695(-)
MEKIEKDTKGFYEKPRRDTHLKAEEIDEIREAFKTSLEYSDEKVALAVQTYEMVDKHIRRLDTDLRKFEAELESVTSSQPSFSPPPTKRKASTAVETLEQNQAKIQKGKGRGQGKTPKSKKTTTHETTTAPITTGDSGVNPADARVLSVDLDMPIDPNEPTYCICKRVSFGEMVGCDNPECKVEWFHFECVGLTNPPKGKWLCPECKKQRGNRT